MKVISSSLLYILRSGCNQNRTIITLFITLTLLHSVIPLLYPVVSCCILLYSVASYCIMLHSITSLLHPYCISIVFLLHPIIPYGISVVPYYISIVSLCHSIYHAFCYILSYPCYILSHPCH